MTLAELDACLKISRWTVGRMAENDPDFPLAHQVGGQRLWRCTQVERRLAARCLRGAVRKSGSLHPVKDREALHVVLCSGWNHMGWGRIGIEMRQ
jgi:hypothetical protein